MAESTRQIEPHRGLEKGRLEEIESFFEGCTTATVLPKQVEELAKMEFKEAKLFAYSRVIIPELIAEIRRRVEDNKLIANLLDEIYATARISEDEMDVYLGVIYRLTKEDRPKSNETRENVARTTEITSG